MRIHMKKKTLQLYQLLLAVLGFFVTVKLSGMLQLTIPFFLLATIFILDKLETDVSEDEQEEAGKTRLKPLTTKEKLEILLRSKNRIALLETIDDLLSDMKIGVAPATGHHNVDRLLTVTTLPVSFGLRVISDVGQLGKDWHYWDDMASFGKGSKGSKRSLLIVSNWVEPRRKSQPKYGNFTDNAVKILRDRQIVAMSTLTFYKIYRLSMEKRRDPARFFELIRQHQGGVFQLEDYKGKTRQLKNGSDSVPSTPHAGTLKQGGASL